MWIRSQNKRDMVDITGKRLFLWYTKQWNIFVDTMVTTEDVSISLGKYESEEKAIEVLDEIQQILLLNSDVNIYQKYDSDGYYIEQPYTKFYQMPEK